MCIIEELCEKYTSLTKTEIIRIQMMADMLQPLANLEDADFFIDCPVKGGDAIVVAQAKPSEVPSSYRKSVVGKFAKQENEPAVARTLRLGIQTKLMKALTQESTCVVQSVEPIKNGKKTIGVLIREKRIEEQYPKSENFHLSQENHENMVNALAHMMDENSWLPECIDEAIIVVNNMGIVIFRNTKAKELYEKMGYINDVLGQMYENICLLEPDDLKKINQFSFIERKVGKHVLAIRYVNLGKENGKFAVVIRDITWMRAQEKELVLKSVVIKEMHHRVKNNLQTIASLLRLQTRRADNEETKRALGESMNRILAIAATHELLAQSGVDQVNIVEVIMNIKKNAVRCSFNSNCKTKILIKSEDFQVDSDIATSAALVINELIQNSLQYAFVDKKEGNIKIEVEKGDLYSTIKVTDDGCGFDVNSIKKSSLGISIVKSLIQDKLHGNCEIYSDKNGTCVSFDFLNQIIDTAHVT